MNLFIKGIIYLFYDNIILIILLINSLILDINIYYHLLLNIHGFILITKRLQSIRIIYLLYK